MKLKIILFAAARDLCEATEIQVELPVSSTIADLKIELTKLFPQLQPLLSRSSISVDQQYAGEKLQLEASHEIAIIPPVSGG